VTDGHAIVCDHQLDTYLRPHFPNLYYVGQRVDVERLPARPPRADVERPVVVHAPSHLAVKGTAHLRRAVQELYADGADFEYDEIADVAHDEVLRRAERADVIVDQLCGGAHGVFAVEAMAMAKPVICNLLPEYAATLPADCPIVNSDPSTIEATLRSWLRRPRDRHERGVASRAYAQRHHDIKVVAPRLLAAYRELPGR
jgi:glycosyltransferase involved in cell wall biosynthesis